MSMIKIVKTDYFDKRVENHKWHMENNPAYVDAHRSLTFAPGKRLNIEIEITDEYLSGNLFNLLHDKVEGAENLGFKLMSIGFDPALPQTQMLEGIDNLIRHLEGIKQAVHRGNL